MKKFLTLILSISMIGLSAGCTNTPIIPSVSTDTGSQTTKSTEPRKITLGMHVANTQEQEKVTWNIVQDFMKENPDIIVDIKGNDKDEHVKNIKISAQSNSLPDIFWMDSSVALELQKADYLLDLNDFLQTNTKVNTALPENMKSAFSDNGKQYGLPYQSLVTGFWYNKAVFEANGVKEPTNGTTYDELIKMVETFKAKDITTISDGAKDPYSIWAFLIGIERYGYFDKIDAILSGKEKFDNPDFVKYFEKLQHLGKAGAFPSNSATMTYFQAKEQFNAGKSAMFDSGMWDAGEFDTTMAENIGFWWGPTFSDSTYNQNVKMKVPSAPLCISKNVATDEVKKQDVYKFLEYYYSEAAANISFEGSVIPATNYESTIDMTKKPAFAAIINALSDEKWISPVAQPDLVLNQAVQAQLYDSIYGTILGTYSPSDALQKIDNVLAQQ